MSIAADLKALRNQVEKLQVEMAGRQTLDAMVVWDGQNGDYVNQVSEAFGGLVVHLTRECDEGIPNVEFEDLKAQILGTLDSPSGENVAGAD